MGLCLGFSGLSAMEVIYFLTLRAWWSSQRKKNFTQRIAKRFKDLWEKTKASRLLQKEQEHPHVVTGDEQDDTLQSKLELESTLESLPDESEVSEPDAVQKVNVSQPGNQQEIDRLKKLTQQSMDYRNILGEIKPPYPPHKY